MIRIEELEILSANMGVENPLADINNIEYIHADYEVTDNVTEDEKRWIGKGMISTILPYTMQDNYNRVRAPRIFKAVVLENEYLRATFLPEIGGRLWSLFDKEKGKGSGYNHLILLCKNETGYKNLIKMVSKSFTEGFYFKPRVDKQLLKEHSEGLIALSACLAGEIPSLLMRNDYEAAKQTALWYKNTFGEGNFYLELQNHGLEAQVKINPFIIKLSKETGIPLVATNDVHYVNKQDAKMQKVLICIQTDKKLSEDNPLAFPTDEFYLKTAEEMNEIFSDIPEALSNTLEIAEKCNFDFEFGKIKLPVFDIGDKDHFEFFREKCFEGLYKHLGENPPEEYITRLNYELDTINKMGYVDYYLIVQDFVNYAKNSDIPVGPGRGSGAGSLAAYCIGITGIDPIKYNLFFERFLNPERVSMPDFDIDFCYVNRQRVIDYVIKKYGSDRVAQIVTFGTMAARAAVRDVGRVMDIPYATCDRTAKLIPRTLGITIEKAIEETPDLKLLYSSDEQVKELLDMAKRVEGMPRHASTHAAGVVISDRAVSEYVPLALNDNSAVTQYTMTCLDELGLLKMDFLGLRNLTIIRDAQNHIKKHTKDFDINNIPLDDKPTYEMMSGGFTDGIFQFESEGMKNVLRQFRPERIEDLTAILSLYRPGPTSPSIMYQTLYKMNKYVPAFRAQRGRKDIQIIQIPTSHDECLYSQALKKEPGSITVGV